MSRSAQRRETSLLTGPPRLDYPHLHSLRAVAALSVVYSHLVGNYLDYTSQSWWFDDLVESVIRTPLRMSDNGGWLGVALFFFITGFFATRSIMTQRTGRYVAGRLVRISVPVIVVVVLLTALTWGGLAIWGISPQLSLGEAVQNALLLNFLLTPGSPMMPQAWTLLVVVLFTMLIVAVAGVLRRWPLAATPLLLIVSAVVTGVASGTGVSRPLAAFLTMIPLVVLGHLVYLAVSHTVSPAYVMAWSALSVLQFVAFAGVTRTVFAGPAAEGYALTTVLAFLLFLLGVIGGTRGRTPAVLQWVADRSYVIYLVHIAVGYTVLLALNDAGWTVGRSMAIAGLALVIIVELTYRSTSALERALR